MSRPAPRRPSRTTTPKPRKIAGRAGSPAETPDGSDRSDGPADDSSTVLPPSPRKPSGSSAPPSPPPKRPVARQPEPYDAGGGGKAQSPALASGAVTRMLLILVGVLVVLLVLQGLWFFLHDRENDDRAEAASSAEPEAAEDDDEYVPITVPSDRPVGMAAVEWQGGVEAAAAAAEAMFTRHYETYDEGVEQAVALMTGQFAEQYRKTTDDIRQESINKLVQVEVRVIAQSVVRANDAELEALVFLNQFTVRGEGDKARTTYTPYRALLKMVHTDKGWLVDDLDTK